MKALDIIFLTLLTIVFVPLVIVDCVVSNLTRTLERLGKEARWRIQDNKY